MIGGALVVLDRDYRVLAVNAAFTRCLRTRVRTVVGKSLFELARGQLNDARLKQLCARAFVEGATFRGCRIEVVFPKVGRKSLVLSGGALPQDAGNAPAMVLLVEDRSSDVPGVNPLDAALLDKLCNACDSAAQAERDLRALNARLTAVHEDQCKDIAHELHDEICQPLAAIALELRTLVDRDATIAVETRRGIESIAERVRVAADALHLASRRLHPGILDDLGLVAALKAESHAIGAALHIPVRFEYGEIPERLDPTVALCLYRVAQEGLRNVQRHARASEVRVSLERLRDQLLLRVCDRGAGFDRERIRNKPCVGLTGMAERVGLLGGELDIQSSPGTGTTILAKVPLTITIPAHG